MKSFLLKALLALAPAEKRLDGSMRLFDTYYFYTQGNVIITKLGNFYYRIGN